MSGKEYYLQCVISISTALRIFVSEKKGPDDKNSTAMPGLRMKVLLLPRRCIR